LSESEQTRIRGIQKAATKNAMNRGGLVLGVDQAHAFAMSATLNKIKGIDDLNDSNYKSWVHQINGALNTIYFNSYLYDVKYDDWSIDKGVNDINCKCLLEFLFSRMDDTNATRFRKELAEIEVPMIRKTIQPTAEELADNPNAQPRLGPPTPQYMRGPAHIWPLIKEYHQADNEANLYLVQSKIEKLQQDYKTSITAHIDEFSKLKNEFLTRGGFPDKNQLGQRLLHSMHSSHTTEVRHILRTVKPISSRNIIAALKQYEDENQEFSFASNGKLSNGLNQMKIASNTSKPNQPKAKCTLSKCLGPHPAAQCFRRPENAKAERE
jgi:hypothetical protein